MEDGAYNYLDDERKKLWEELRRIQVQVESLVDTLNSDQSAIEKGLRSLSIKASRAYNRIAERDARSEAQATEFESCLGRSKGIADKLVEISQSVEAVSSSVYEASQKVNEGMIRFDAEMESRSSRVGELEKQIETIGQYLEAAREHRDELNTEVEDFAEKYDDNVKKHAEIVKLHSLIFGYTKNDGEIVEGKKQELEKAYDALEQKIDSVRENAEKFENEYKEHIAQFLNDSKSEADALASKVRGLLPDAMTAGLSAAYQANRKMEEDEQAKQFTTFKWCIGGMMALSLLPIAINLCLWLLWNKSFLDILAILPREMMYILPIYIPLFWLAIFANKRVNLSKRLIEVYKHKEAVSKTYEGLSKQIAELDDDAASRELQARLLYNTVMLSENNPGELIKNFNRPDNPLVDVLNHGAKFTESIDKLKRFPGLDGIMDITKTLPFKQSAATKEEEVDNA